MADEVEQRRSLPGRLASAVYPDLDYALWRRRRRREIARDLATVDYSDIIERRTELSPADSSAIADEAPVRVVIVPQEGVHFESFRAATWNIYYEAAESLRDLVGAENVDVFSVEPGERPASWHVRLLDFLIDSGATHLLVHVEHDPGSAGELYTWDVFWSLASRRWNGVLLGVLFDSSYAWIAAGSKHLAQMSPRFMVVDLCVPMDGTMVRGRPEVGPVNMPISQEAIGLVDARLDGVEPSCDVSFIGAMYPYRVDVIDRLKSMGMTVAVNPHRDVETRDLHESRSGRPGWLEYMAALRGSRMTINFSQSSAGPFEQLKTRVLEATLARTLLLTDDRDRTRLFWTPDVEYAYFAGPPDLPAVVSSYLEDPMRLAEVARAGERRARQLASTNFWEGIEAGLMRRSLPPVLGSRVLRPTPVDVGEE